MHDFRRLACWQKVQRITALIYELSEPWHWSEPLRGQMRRSAVSIGSNIAEGCGRGSRGELLHFLSYAAGSASELDSQLETARILGMAEQADQMHRELKSLKRAIYGLRRSMDESSAGPSTTPAAE